VDLFGVYPEKIGGLREDREGLGGNANSASTAARSRRNDAGKNAPSSTGAPSFAASPESTGRLNRIDVLTTQTPITEAAPP
jgi:hypothetical protein